MRSSICLPIAILWAFAATGCSILPASGPTVAEVENSSKSDPSQGFVVVDDPSQGFVVVDIDAAVASAVSQVRQDGFGGNFKSNAPAANLRIAVGDVMQITIIEAGSGLFRQSDSSARLLGEHLLIVRQLRDVDGAGLMAGNREIRWVFIYTLYIGLLLRVALSHSPNTISPNSVSINASRSSAAFIKAAIFRSSSVAVPRRRGPKLNASRVTRSPGNSGNNLRQNSSA